MKTEITLPRVGTNMEEAVISKWLRSAGDRITKGEILYEIETDKVTSDVEAPADGILIEILIPAGETAAVGQVVAIIE